MRKYGKGRLSGFRLFAGCFCTLLFLSGCGSLPAVSIRTAAAAGREGGPGYETAAADKEGGSGQETAETGKEGGPGYETAETVRVTLNIEEKQTEAETEPAGKYDALLADEAYCLENRIYGKEAADPDEVTLVFAGDILFDESYAIMSAMKSRGTGIEGSISGALLERMRGADVFMVNNEFTYTDRGTPIPGKSFTFRARPEYASYLLDMGADIVSLANNHTFDYGEVSLTDTLSTLEALGMPYVGAGRNLAEAVSPVYFVINDIKIGIVSATQIERMSNPSTRGATETSPGVFRCMDITKLLEVIGEARAECDYLVVYVHWGTESTDKLDHWQREQAPQIAAAGADLIIGDHPHVLQPIGYCGQVPVVYSLGNFLFNSSTRDSCLVEATLNEDGLKSLQFIPAVQTGCRVREADDSETARILAYMRSISPEASIDGAGYITKAQE